MAFDFEKWMTGPHPRQTTFQNHPDYDGLPESIKMLYSAEEYAWLSNEDRANLIDRECTPEPDGD